MSSTLKRALISSLICSAYVPCRCKALGNNIHITSGQVACVTSDLKADVNKAIGGMFKVQLGYTLTIAITILLMVYWLPAILIW